MINRLQKERSAFPLNIEKLTEYLHGGPEEHKLHKQALEYVLTKTNFLDEDYGYYDRSRADKRKQSMAVIRTLKEIVDDVPDEKLVRKIFSIISYTKLGTLNRYSLSVLFSGNGIAGQGTKEQADFYIPKLQKLQMTACYGITELATGSYIKAFQTTATFIHETDEFEIHTPNLLATKWWVGDAAQTATHGVIIAKLIIDGQNLGAHNFIIPLRNENFQLLKGVKVGDIGPKRGSDCTDNGWMQFEHVRIPRTNMLMKWSQVDREGNYTKGAATQISYGTLVVGRVLIARAVVENTKKAIAIAARYTVVRDQFTMEGKGLLDYTVQQERIIGGLSAAYAYQIATNSLIKYYEQVEKELAEKNVTHLKELHNNAAAMKGFVALWSSKTMNECIMALGGHGFSELSEIPNILVDTAPTIPYEGDAVVLVQQTASYLVKSAADIFMGKPIEGESIQYLQNLTNTISV